MMLGRTHCRVLSRLQQHRCPGALGARILRRRSSRVRIFVSASQGTELVGGPGPGNSTFTGLERLITNTFNSSAPGQRNDWREVEGAWVLHPPNDRAPEAVVHFLGAAFVGAAPQLTYRLFLEALSNRNVLIIATPYSTSFDHLRIADEAQFKFDHALRSLGPETGLLPVYGVGHSLGAVVHLLISARYAVARTGNAFLSFNNRSAVEVVPLFSPLIAPSARLLGPLLTQIAASPVRSTVESAMETLRGLSPSLLRQLAPLMEQLAPLYMDIGQGRVDTSPSSEETSNLVRSYYSVPRNLLLRFKNDDLDDTGSLASLLQGSPAVSEMLDLTVRTLPGDHLRPLQQALVDLPPDVARMANQAVYAGGDVIGRLAGMATQMGMAQASGPLAELSKGVVGFASTLGGEVGGPVTDSMQGLADEVAAWIGTGEAVLSGSRALPARSVFTDRPQFGSPAPGNVGSRSPSAMTF
ncbi:hypothetical protein V8C86DRAFT_2671657 [Haematococcus lacustris]